MEGPCEAKRQFLVYGYWHREQGHPYVLNEYGQVETHVYDDLEEALDFIKEHSQWNVNITWCLTWDVYEIEKLINYIYNDKGQ